MCLFILKDKYRGIGRQSSKHTVRFLCGVAEVKRNVVRAGRDSPLSHHENMNFPFYFQIFEEHKILLIVKHYPKIDSAEMYWRTSRASLPLAFPLKGAIYLLVLRSFAGCFQMNTDMKREHLMIFIGINLDRLTTTNC